jgi:large subunit ribosomal protein L29
MKTDKVRNFTDEELRHQEHELNDQLFKLKFQLNMGQTESLKKIRGLRKDIARVKTIGRERELATGTSGSVTTAVAPRAAAAKTIQKTVQKKTVAKKAKPKTERK